MKYLLALLVVGMLSACSSMAALRTSFNGQAYASDPTDPSDARLRQRSFYLDHDATPQWRKATPRSNE